MALEFGLWDHFERQDPERVPLRRQYREPGVARGARDIEHECFGLDAMQARDRYTEIPDLLQRMPAIEVFRPA